MAEAPILFASYSGLLGGAERVLLDAVTRLDRSLAVACPDGPLAAELRAVGVEHHPLKTRPLRTRPNALWGMARELAKLPPPAVFVAWGARAGIACSLRPRAPLVAVHHDLHRSAAVRGAVRATARRAKVLAAASQAIADELRLDARVLHPGVDLEHFTPAPLPDGPPHAVVIGALVGWKRPELALEIARRMPELRLTFAGAPLPGEERELPQHERVTYAGHIDDVRPLLNEAHLLLHCADAEPYGLALVEALAAGRPVVAPAAAGPLEIVRDGAGRLYPPGDAEAAAHAIHAVFDDPEAPYAARRRAETSFDVHASVRRLEEAIDVAILGERPPADVTV